MLCTAVTKLLPYPRLSLFVVFEHSPPLMYVPSIWAQPRDSRAQQVLRSGCSDLPGSGAQLSPPLRYTPVPGPRRSLRHMPLLALRRPFRRPLALSSPDIAGTYDVHGCSRPVHFLFRAPRAYVGRSHLFTFRSRTRCPAGCPFVPVLRPSHIRWRAVEHVAPWTQEAVARLPHPGLLARGATGRRVPANTGCDLRNTWEVPGGGTPNTPSPGCPTQMGGGTRQAGTRFPRPGSGVKCNTPCDPGALDPSPSSCYPGLAPRQREER